MLTGKIAVVTGASRGIGKEIAKTLAAKGATVVVNYNGSAAKAEETVKEIEALGGKAEALQCNVSEYDKAAEMMEYVVKTYGRVDILVNNAGITRDNLLMKMSEEDFDAVLNTNLKGAFNCIKHISRQMLKQKSGHIVNISSVSGVMGLAPMDGILPSTPTWSASSPMDLRKPSTIFVSASVSCFRSHVGFLWKALSVYLHREGQSQNSNSYSRKKHC